MSGSDLFWLSIAGFGMAAATLASVLACRWWFGRKLAAAAQRLRKSDQGRLFAQQQVQDARLQMESLKRELAAERQRSSMHDAGQRRTRELEEQLKEAERVVADHGALRPMPLQPAHGFADTQILA